MISVTATTSSIMASASAQVASASVSSSNVSASASGGIGPPGAAVSNLGDLADVELAALSTGDILRRNGSKWQNVPDASLVDGGNFG